jgi:16S rRNA (guanine527-N7)-methyltransferase
LIEFESLKHVAGDVSRETFDSLVELHATLAQWNRSINLVSPTTLSDAWNRHVLDSAQLWPLIRGAEDLADLGSGGGFPGLVLAVFLRETPGKTIRLVESNRKKAAFLQTVTGKLSLPATVVTQRIEDVVQSQPAPEIVTARALAPLPSLLSMTEPWFLDGAKALLHKGRDYQKEVKESADKWSFHLIEHRSVIDGDSVILEIEDVRKR